MKIHFQAILIVITLFSCAPSQQQQEPQGKSQAHIEQKAFQKILDSTNVAGAILIYDQKKNTYYSNNFQKAKESSLPASTFKIPNSIIGLELGLIEGEQTIFEWDGEKRAYAFWEKDLALKEAFQQSCVPCYQEMARKIGTKRMQENLDKLHFGEMDVTDKNIDLFWLEGQSKINPFQQIDFLLRLYQNQLPIKKTTTETVKNILKIKTTDGYIWSGKTGLSVIDQKDTGWFVGYIEKKDNVFYFATKITPKTKELSRKAFISLRKEVTILALTELGIIE